MTQSLRDRIAALLCDPEDIETGRHAADRILTLIASETGEPPNEIKMMTIVHDGGMEALWKEAAATAEVRATAEVTRVRGHLVDAEEETAKAEHDLREEERFHAITRGLHRDTRDELDRQRERAEKAEAERDAALDKIREIGEALRKAIAALTTETLAEAHARGKREGMIEALEWVCEEAYQDTAKGAINEAQLRLAELEKEETGR